MKHFIIAREGWIFIALALILIVVVYVLAPEWTFFPFVLMLFTAFFFRNPRRNIPAEDGVIVSPADGVVMKVEPSYEDRFLNSDSVKVSIFLSILNVHINRTPVEGTVEYVEKVSGRFLPAYKNEAGYLNAKNILGLDTKWGKVMVVQITGLIARRIVCWAKEGDTLETGERFGLIRFGSCTEIFLPTTAALAIKPGDKVKGGITIIGRFTD